MQFDRGTSCRRPDLRPARGFACAGAAGGSAADRELADPVRGERELHASLRLTQWLRCKFHIPVHDVIGHAESLSSPYHRELVPSLRRQTHGDWRHASMQVYRRKLRRLGRCP
jgi:hypothetical protein